LGGLTDRDERGEENRRSSVLERGSDADGEVTRAHRLGRMRLDLELPERSTRLRQRTLGRAFSFALVTFGLEHERHRSDRVPRDCAQWACPDFLDRLVGEGITFLAQERKVVLCWGSVTDG